tara:strand:- start:430 stop:597 length:168 start_codon:yes stop_codon:yes gene_type:complete
MGKYSVKENTIRFHGKPLKTKPLIYSTDPKIIEKIKIEEILLFKLNIEEINVANP